jgi:hypothetical protein
MPGRLLIAGALVRTGDPARPSVEAIGLEADRVAALGSAREVRARLPGAREIHLPGATLLPGLSDSHGHLLDLGQSLALLDLSGLSDPAQLASAVAVAAAEVPEWILGRGWDQSRYPGGAFPDRALLDAAAPGRRVFLERIDGHAALVSSRVLSDAGLLDIADPPGGRILRRADGSPTGVLVDAALEPARSLIPAPAPEALEQLLLAAAQRCAALGLTCVHDAGLDFDSLEALDRLAARGALPVRVYAMIRATDPRAARVRALGPRVGERLTLRCAKLFLDGALGSRGAALFDDYSDEPGNRGLLLCGGELTLALAAWMRAGFQVALHAIGDRANALALDALEQSLGSLPEADRADRRPRLEHAQVLRPMDLPRLVRLGAVASMQPTHATSDMGWAGARLGPQRLRGAYAWRSLLEAGAVLAFGSDFPIETPDPLRGIFAACARQDAGGGPVGGFLPEERLTRAQAIAAYTSGPAWAAFDEARGGRLCEGSRADLSAFSVDLLDAPASELLSARAVLTVVGGRVVHGPAA